MEGKPTSRPQKALCINVEKVYDWIVEESTGSTTVQVGSLPIALPADATNVEVKCILTNEEGTPLPLNTALDVTEAAPREDQQFQIGHRPVTLQRVTFTKTLYVVLEITGVDPATGTPFLITSNPVTFNFIETAFLCAPEGTTLVVRVSNFSCLTVIRTNDEEEITGFGLQIFVCQSIQMVSPLTIELEGTPCMPREALLEQCPNPTSPPECPSIFPRR